MRQLAVGLFALGVLLVACGSGDDAPQPTGTATSQRVERQATVAQQQQETSVQQESVEAESAQSDQRVQQTQQAEQAQQAAERVEPSQQIQEAEEELEDEPQADEWPAEIVGLHKGVRSERHVLGEPDAPVEIRYFGDFT